jgi:hypothetical protein
MFKKAGEMETFEQNTPIQTLKKMHVYGRLWELLTFSCDQECYGIIHYLPWIRCVQTGDYIPYQENSMVIPKRSVPQLN